jgi:hypothetical protein
VLPILHLPSFATDYEDFWAERASQTQHDSSVPSVMRKRPGFVSLLAAIVFSSLLSGTARQLDVAQDAHKLHVGDMYFATVMAATLTGFPRRPTLYSLAAYMFSQSQFVREEEFSEGPSFIITAFRVALGMGLHRKLEEAGFTGAEQETRRRIWWYILHLDTMSACSSGLSPLFVDEKMANSSMISISDSLAGEYFSPDAPQSVDVHDDSSQLAGADIRYLFARVRYESSQIMRKILLKHFEDDLRSSDAVLEMVQVIERLGLRVKSAVHQMLAVGSDLPRARLLEIYRDYSMVESATEASHIENVWSFAKDENRPHVVGFAAWAASIMHLMLHKAYCVLYFPIAKDQQSRFGAEVRTT